jgi:putative ABC transport system ATP-binding protein
MDPTVVELRQAGRRFEGNPPVHALRPADLRVCSGEYVAIMGPSGSGKSTLLYMLGLLDTPTSGQYLLDGVATAEMSESERADVRAFHIGFVFQAFHLIGYRSAVENVEIGLLYQHLKPRVRRQRAIDELTRVGLSHRLWATPPRMSGGERQRVAIARALVRRPAVLLCDEPTGNLDSVTTGQILDLLGELHNDGLTIVVITHEAEVARRAQRVIVMRDGELSEPDLGPAE